MFLIDALNNPELVAKFQSAFGVERLPDPTGVDESENTDDFGNADSYEKYVKHRHTQKYVLQENYTTNNNKNNNLLNSTHVQDLQREGVPPFTSDDSDSDNGTNSWHKTYKVTPHRIKYKSAYYAFKFASFFGDESFYLTCLPFIIWNIDSFVMRHVMIVWGIAMYCGQVGKDMFQWSRPSTPPVVRLDTDFAQEYSMPSTHAVAASSIPLVMAYTIIGRYELPTELVVGVACLWCTMTCGSRLYLGVHSLLDVMAGCFISFAVAVVMLPFINEISWFIQTSPASPVVLFLTCLALSTILYPAPEIGNNTRGDAVKIIATVTGCLLGQWANYFNGMSIAVPPEGLFIVAMPSLKCAVSAILRFMIGVITLILVKTVVQTVTLKGVIAFFGLRKKDKMLPKVQVPYRFITYMTLGVIITWTVPILHSKFGLGRTAIYTEVL